MSQISVASRQTSMTPVNLVESIEERRTKKNVCQLTRIFIGIGIFIGIFIGTTAIVFAVKFRS